MSYAVTAAGSKSKERKGKERKGKSDDKPPGLAGSVGPDIDAVRDKGITAVFSILTGASTLEDALKWGAENLRFSAQSLARLLKLSDINAPTSALQALD
ncbi:glycerate kinase [Marinobacterium sp. YM272]|uniref:glycerate kinase n=1 Tax=Marinobacterium sp. YM272 TaxID=3421654 RepID=UPI003D7FF6E6